MSTLSYSPQLVDLARAASLAALKRASDAEPLFRAYIASLRSESEPFPKAILPAYFVTGVDPRAEDGYIAAAIAHAAFILELALPVDVIDTFTIAARQERTCSAQELATLIARRSGHVVWSINDHNSASDTYRVTTFPKSFSASAIEVWWPLVRPEEAPVLLQQADGSWQELTSAQALVDVDLAALPHRSAKRA